jgi:hypothetical protein
MQGRIIWYLGITSRFVFYRTPKYIFVTQKQTYAKHKNHGGEGMRKSFVFDFYDDS